jgi:hypothetical protein
MLEDAGQIVSLADDGCQAVELLKINGLMSF